MKRVEAVFARSSPSDLDKKVSDGRDLPQGVGRRQARHARILQIGLHLAIAQADTRPAMPVSFR